MRIRLTVNEQSFRCDHDARLMAGDRVLEFGDERDRLALARDWKQAGHALIAAADAIALRVQEEEIERERHG